MKAPTLRPYQVDQLNAIVDGLKVRQNRLLIKSPTGTGKTVMFAGILQHPPIRKWIDGLGGGKMMVIAHREELLDQAAKKIHAANPHARVMVEQADRVAGPHADVVVASIQTLAAGRFRRLKRLLEYGTFRVVVVDEAHHAAANTYRGALALMGFLPRTGAVDDAGDEELAPSYEDVADLERDLAGWESQAPKDRVLLGVTATPNRTDAIGLGCVFQTLAYSYELKQAIRDGWLVPITPWVIETTTDLDSVRISRGEFNQKDLGETVNTAQRNKLAVTAWSEYGDRRSTLAFTVDVAHAHALADEFRAADVTAAAISGETPKDERRQLLQAYSDGRLTVLTNCMVLTEGTDLPRTGCILHAKPTKSATLYEQMTGRGLRLFEGKADCIVIDLVDVAKRHSLQASPVLVGLPPGIKADGKSLTDLEDEYNALIEKCPSLKVGDYEHVTLEQLQARAATFDIWSIPAMGDFGTGLTMRWIRINDELFRVQYPYGDAHEVLTVQKNLLGQFEVAKVQRTVVEDKWVSSAPEIIATAFGSANHALKSAEHYVATHRRQAAQLKDTNAPWRRGKPSSKAIGYLKQLMGKARFNEVVQPTLAKKTAGDISDLIDLAKSRRA